MKPKFSWIQMGSTALCASLLLGGLQAQAPAKQKPVPPKDDNAPAQDTQPVFKALIFPSKDGLALRADLYAPHKDPKTPLIVLFHQAGWSRGEYQAIAPRLNRMGFNCLALDQRSGNAVNGIVNETAKRAEASKLPTEYVDAKQDMEAALAYARKQLTTGTLLAWGSSYSAALVLQIAGEQPLSVDGVLAFAPGEYFKTRGKHWIAKSAAGIQVPVFITSAKSEEMNWKGIFDSIKSLRKTRFLPKTEGNHGSRALWRKFKDSPEYWVAVSAFLQDFLPKISPDSSEEKPGSTPVDPEIPKKKPAPVKKPRVQ
jgi:dienelactone hydrolase